MEAHSGHGENLILYFVVSKQISNVSEQQFILSRLVTNSPRQSTNLSRQDKGYGGNVKHTPTHVTDKILGCCTPVVNERIACAITTRPWPTRQLRAQTPKAPAIMPGVLTIQPWPIRLKRIGTSHTGIHNTLRSIYIDSFCVWFSHDFTWSKQIVDPPGVCFSRRMVKFTIHEEYSMINIHIIFRLVGNSAYSLASIRPIRWLLHYNDVT